MPHALFDLQRPATFGIAYFSYRKTVPVLLLVVADATATLCNGPDVEGDTDAACAVLSLLHARVRAATLTMITAAVLRRSLGEGFTGVANLAQRVRA